MKNYFRGSSTEKSLKNTGLYNVGEMETSSVLLYTTQYLVFASTNHISCDVPDKFIFCSSILDKVKDKW
jgi:hypothetical protein